MNLFILFIIVLSRSIFQENIDEYNGIPKKVIKGSYILELKENLKEEEILKVFTTVNLKNTIL